MSKIKRSHLSRTDWGRHVTLPYFATLNTVTKPGRGEVDHKGDGIDTQGRVLFFLLRAGTNMHVICLF